VDSATGAVTGWNPGQDGSVKCIVPSGGVVYVGGIFQNMGGGARHCVAAIDTSTGVATGWNPVSASAGGVNALALNLAKVVVGGAFTDMGGQLRSNIAEVDATTGLATGWNPGSNQQVLTLAGVTSAGGYAGGTFSTIGGMTRPHIASLSSGGSADPWNPDADNSVSTLSVTPSAVFAGGDFANIGHQRRTYLARISRGDPPALAASVLSPNGGERALVTSTRDISWGAAGPYGIQSVDLQLSRSGPSGPWESIAYGLPNTGDYAWFVTGPPVSNDAYVRVDAHDYSGAIVSDLSDAAFTITTDPATSPAGPATNRFALHPPVPNPSAARSRVAFDVPIRSRVRVSLEDLEGREVARLEDQLLDPGPHSLAIETGPLRPGLYFLRLQAPGARLSQRIAILH
jgi:hypothetical protein